MPVPTENAFPGVLADIVAGRVANRLDVGGVKYTVDAACAASPAALDVAYSSVVASGVSRGGDRLLRKSLRSRRRTR